MAAGGHFEKLQLFFGKDGLNCAISGLLKSTMAVGYLSDTRYSIHFVCAHRPYFALWLYNDCCWHDGRLDTYLVGEDIKREREKGRFGENNARWVYIRIDWSQSKVFLVSFFTPANAGTRENDWSLKKVSKLIDYGSFIPNRAMNLSRFDRTWV